jgi:hypothetical protein
MQQWHGCLAVCVELLAMTNMNVPEPEMSMSRAFIE